MDLFSLYSECILYSVTKWFPTNLGGFVLFWGFFKNFFSPPPPLFLGFIWGFHLDSWRVPLSQNRTFPVELCGICCILVDWVWYHMATTGCIIWQNCLDLNMCTFFRRSIRLVLEMVRMPEHVYELTVFWRIPNNNYKNISSWMQCLRVDLIK